MGSYFYEKKTCFGKKVSSYTKICVEIGDNVICSMAFA